MTTNEIKRYKKALSKKMAEFPKLWAIADRMRSKLRQKRASG